MYPLKNPYNWQQVNPDFFYGYSRLNLVDSLKNGLSNGQSFGVTGGRRMGKTTLLRRLEKDLLKYTQDTKNGGLIIIPVYIETLAIPIPSSSLFSSDILYQEIMNKLKQCLCKQNIFFSLDFQTYDHQTLKDYLYKILDSVVSHRLQIAFIFDEIELISKSQWGNSFFANWRSLLSNTPNLQEYLSAVFCGADEMFKISRDVGSPLGNILEWQELNLLSLEDISNLLCEPIQHDWADDFIKKVFDLTGGHPFITQYLMQIVCSKDIGRATQSLEEAKNQFLRNQKFQFQNWWDKFDGTTKMIYARIAESDSISVKSLLKEFGRSSDKSISVLSHTGIANYCLNEVSLAGSLFKEWFNHFGDLNVTSSLASQLDEQLKEVERKLRQLLVNHFDNKKPSWLREHFEKKNPKRWSEILKRIEKKYREKNGRSLSEDDKLLIGNDEVLRRLDLGELFELTIMKTEWNSLCRYFVNLSSDPKIAMSRLEERKDLLVNIRNDMRHVNEDEIESNSFLKAQVFCIELLESLSFLFDHNDNF